MTTKTKTLRVAGDNLKIDQALNNLWEKMHEQYADFGIISIIINPIKGTHYITVTYKIYDEIS